MGHLRAGDGVWVEPLWICSAFCFFLRGGLHEACKGHVCQGLLQAHSHLLEVVFLWHDPAHHMYLHLAALTNRSGVVDLEYPQVGQEMVRWVGRSLRSSLAIGIGRVMPSEVDWTWSTCRSPRNLLQLGTPLRVSLARGNQRSPLSILAMVVSFMLHLRLRRKLAIPLASHCVTTGKQATDGTWLSNPSGSSLLPPPVAGPKYLRRVTLPESQ